MATDHGNLTESDSEPEDALSELVPSGSQTARASESWIKHDPVAVTPAKELDPETRSEAQVGTSVSSDPAGQTEEYLSEGPENREEHLAVFILFISFLLDGHVMA